jgi:ATP-dependent helicase/nuclease subunit A
LRNLVPQLLHAGRPVQVRTFHSWFAALLRNAPLQVLHQLGLPASYELLEDDKRRGGRRVAAFHAAVVAQPEARPTTWTAVATHGRFQTQKALLAALAKRVEFAWPTSAGHGGYIGSAFGAISSRLCRRGAAR